MVITALTAIATSTLGLSGCGGSTPTDQTPDASTCDFSTSYDYGLVGGLGSYVDRSYLAPGNHYRYTRTPQPPGEGRGNSDTECAPALPSCGAEDVITAYDIEVHDLVLSDVRAALAKPTPPLYGYDSRPTDGSIFEFKRGDGRGYLVGGSCIGSAVPTCVDIPLGIA